MRNVIRAASCFILFTATLLSLTNPANAQAGESWADLRYMGDANAPVIAREVYYFSRNLIACRSRQEQIDRNEKCWGLSTPEPFGNIDLFEPEKAETLNQIAAQIGPDGAFRPQAELILQSAGYSGEDLDVAMANNFHAWNTGMDWANVLQVRMEDRHIFYVAFYKEHQGAKDVPVDAAIVPLPGTTRPEPRGYTPPSTGPLTAADFYLIDGEYAKCAQQALLDAGFDPKGVDGAPGKGARAALEGWSQANGIPLPAFTRDTAPQICHALTAKPAYPNADRQLVETNVWPVWSGSVFYNDNMADFSLATEGSNLLQVSAMNFRGGLRYGNQNNADLSLPWSPAGVVILDGSDGRDGMGGGGQTPYAGAMLGLIDAMTGDTGRRSFEQMLGANRASVEWVRRALGATEGVRNLPETPTWEVAWTIVDHANGRDIVAADILTDISQNDRRVLIFMAHDANGSDHQLLYASVPIATAAPRAAESGGFPEVSGDTHVSGLFNADCDPGTPPARSKSVAEYDGFSGHPVRFCKDGNIVLDLMAWTKTNAEGTALSIAVTLLNGQQLQVQGSGYDESTGTNTFEVGINVNEVPVVCTIDKPGGGISVNGEAICM